jgi:hypothetical protein
MKDGKVEEKIDDLTRMVAEGFTDVRAELKKLRDKMVTKDDLAELRSELKENRRATR